MIKQTCDRCGESRYAFNNPNEIDSLEYIIFKTHKELKATPKNSRGAHDEYWRVRLCPIHSALCESCMRDVIDGKGSVRGGWLQEGDYHPEAYDLVQTSPERKIARFKGVKNNYGVEIRLIEEEDEEILGQ